MSGKTILVIEDNEIQREGAAVVLRDAGYTVAAAADAAEALALLKKGLAADLILLDMLIPYPGTDGWRFMELRKKTPALATVPVAIMTGLGVASDAWAASLGACRLLRKPVEGQALLECVRQCLGARPG